MVSFFELWVSFKYLFPSTRDKYFSLITIFSFLGISLGVATLIIVMSVMNGFREELTSKILGINGHLKIQTINSSKIIKHLKLKNELNSEIDDIFINEIIIDQGLISYQNYSSGAILKGVNSNFLEQREIFSNKISKDSLKEFNLNNGILIGHKLRKKLGIKVGDSLNVISPNSYETIFGNLTRSSSFTVVGFFDTGMYEYDVSLIIFPLKIIQEFLDMGSKIDFLEIQLKEFEDITKIKNKLEILIPKYYKIIDWRELNPSLFNAIEVEKNVMFLILLLIIIVAAFNLISSMIILVSNKKRDIGVLRVLGVSKKQLLKIFILNGFSIGFVGTFLGLILGLIFCYNINDIKEFIELFSGLDLFSEEIYFFSQLPVILDFSQISTIVVISLILSFLATIYPSLRATNVEPINLIKWD